MTFHRYPRLTSSDSFTNLLTFAAFLNKKSWHTGGIPMQAEVWKREQEKAHEERRLEEMRKEIAEERKLQELRCRLRRPVTSTKLSGSSSCTRADL